MSEDGARPLVLFLFSEVFANGGIQRFNQTLLDATARLGLSGLVLTLQDSDASISNSAPRERIKVIGFGGDRRGFALALTERLIRDRFDFIVIGHVNLLSLVATMLAMRRSRQGKSILIAHGIEVWSGIGRLRRLALSRVDKILCVSHYTRQRILAQAPALNPNHLVVFPNALAEIWRQITPTPYSAARPERFILSVTRLEPADRYKGISTVIEAFSMLADDSLHYLIIGHGGDLQFLQLVAARCGVADRVHFLRGIGDSELVSFYENCLAFVLPSGKEGFGIVFLEAMFFGAPVIAASEKGAVDVVRDGETGIVVRFGDTIAIKEAIERLQVDTSLRDRLCANGRSLVSDQGPFTFASFVERTKAHLAPEGRGAGVAGTAP